MAYVKGSDIKPGDKIRTNHGNSAATVLSVEKVGDRVVVKTTYTHGLGEHNYEHFGRDELVPQA